MTVYFLNRDRIFWVRGRDLILEIMTDREGGGLFLQPEGYALYISFQFRSRDSAGSWQPGAGSFILDNNNLVIPSAQPHFETSAFQYWNTARVLERICVFGTNFRAL